MIGKEKLIFLILFSNLIFVITRYLSQDKSYFIDFYIIDV